MIHELDGIISQYEKGTISRRQLLGTLALALAAGSGEAQAQTAPVVCPGLTLNHFHLDVTNLDRSVKFWQDLVGGKIRDTAPNNATLSLPGKPYWISLTQTKDNGKIGYNHVAVGIDFDNADRLAATINQRWPTAKAEPAGPTTKGPNTRSVYASDPDGTRFQIVPKEDDGWLPTGVVGSRILKGEKL